MSDTTSERPSEPTGGTSVRRLRLNRFRNYPDLDLACGADIVVLAGPNGAGKTNLLEALSLLSPGRGLRGASLGELGYELGYGHGHGRGSADWSIVADLATPDGPLRIGTGLDMGGDPDAGRRARSGARSGAGSGARGGTRSGARRALRIDGQSPASQSALEERIGIVWMTPEMDRLFHDGASARRRFLDRLVAGFDPGHAGRVAAYTKAIRERARLLKTNRDDANWLAAVEARAAGQGVAVAAARRDVVQRLNAALGAQPEDALPHAHIDVAGAVEAWLADMPAVTAEDRFRAALEADRPADAAAGRTATGPHRSDLEARHVGQDCPVARCSTGEQKAILVNLVLAYACSLADCRPSAPILLLDEAVAHLDPERRHALFSRLAGYGGQIWISATELSPLVGLSEMIQTYKPNRTIDVFRVENGLLAAESPLARDVAAAS